uniref:Uncharacterized protein n=2 Tax=Callorhinchus milii TaxID=7868 RepID=A0A4W3HLJ6_CALMI
DKRRNYGGVYVGVQGEAATRVPSQTQSTQSSKETDKNTKESN